MRKHLVPSLLASGMLLSWAATADVVEANTSAMKIKEVVQIAGPVESVYKTFLKIGTWWDKEHTFSGDAANLSLTAVPGGCLCETLLNGGGAEHLTVVFVAPNQRITLRGALGPLQATGVAGAMSFSFMPKASGTELVLVYNVGGYYPNGLQSVADGVNDVLLQQMQRLKNLVETGNAAGPPAKSGTAN